MQTTQTLTKNNFKELKAENEKLGLLDKQMVTMVDDFEDMKRTREEAKKQLEAKFQDVYRKIQTTKDFIASEGKRINDTLLAFQSKFDHQLNQMAQNFQEKHDLLSKDMSTQFTTVHVELKELDKKIIQEREDRLKQTDETLKVIRQQISTLEESLNTERQQRIDGEKNLLQKLSDEAFTLNSNLDHERTERILKTKELRDDTNYELKQLQKLGEEFHVKTVDEFNHIANNLSNEMINRFEHQDKIVDNLSNIVKTVQDTLKVIGSDV